MKALYRYLHPFWSHFPFPYTPYFRETQLGPLRSVEMARVFFGQRWLTVRTYLVGDTLIDTGLACMGRRLARWAQEREVHKALVTHHHEDHSGNAHRLSQEGIEVYSSPDTQKILRHGFPIRLYQHLVWGAAPRSHTKALSARAEIGKYEAQVIEAPGHCDDQVVFFIAEEGWLFSGDAFLHEKIRFFRADEDFAKTVASLRRILELDFDGLYCAHRPRPKGGKQALVQKLDWLESLREEVHYHHGLGRSPREIARRVLAPRRNNIFGWFAGGDVSAQNLVRSILEGPTHRPEIAALFQQESR